MKIIQKLLIIMLLIFISLANCSNVFAVTNLVNSEDQYMELKVVSVEDVEGEDKQVTLEWWSHNLNFKAVDLRFAYDSTKIKPSSLQDNSYVTDESSFEFEGDFASYMGYMVLGAENGEYRCIMSLDEYDDAGNYIENDETLGYIVNSNVEGGVLLGRMSFRLFSGDIDETTFVLKTGGTSPKTGIEISQTLNSGYSDPSVFRFSVLSNDASLNKIEYDFFNYEEDGDSTLPELTYESLDLTKKDAESTELVSKYTIELLEDVDNVSLKLGKSHEKATVKINDEEIDLVNSKELVLNELGKGDTIIDIEVTAQDGTVHTYELVVKRPYGTIKGIIQYDVIEENENPDINKTTDLNIYKTGRFNWDELKDIFGDVYDNPATYDDLDALEKDVYKQSEEDGTFEIYVVPGTYDLQIDKRGFLDYIVTNIEVSEGSVIDLGNRILIAGDVNRDGVIGLEDIQEVVERMDVMLGDPEYSESYDLVQYEVIGLESLQYTVENIDQVITIMDNRI